jgi:hypothetical protein
MAENIRHEEQPDLATVPAGTPTSGEGAARVPGRRSFLRRGMAALGTAGVAGLLGDPRRAQAAGPGGITAGDADILRFLAAAEIIESDLWQQYNELAGIQDGEVPGGSGNQIYQDAILQLDSDMPQYIHDNTQDEFTHWFFINGFLQANGFQPVDLSAFATLPSSQATGAQQIGRLTNLMELTVDTTWWSRYRDPAHNPDLEPHHEFPPAVPGLMHGRFPAIPRTDEDLFPHNHIQAIANTAGFHFGTIEQGGTSLYPALAQRVHSVTALRVLLSIGPTEAMHFQTWHDKAGNAPAITDPTNGLTFPDLSHAGELLQANKIMPEPCPFLSNSLPPCSIVRPTETQGVAMGVVKFLTREGLFRGQSQAFFNTLQTLAMKADAAQRGF